MDWLIFQKINQWAGQWPSLDLLGVFFAQSWGYFLILFFLLFLLINWRKHWWGFLQSLLSAFLARFVFVEIIRYFWPRPRPFVKNQIHLLLEKTDQAAFPSGHAAFYFALSTALFLFLRKKYPTSKLGWCVGIFFLISCCLMSVARVFVGVHWPSDVLAGALLGILTAWLVDFFSTKFLKK